MDALVKPRIIADTQTVTSVTHWTESLFSFRLTRPASLRFRSGEFVMIGLPGDNGKPILRAYSIASPSWDDELEFYSIKVQDGPLTSRLQHISIGDEVILRPKPVGTLVLDALLPGRNLYLVATGTGIAPFASILRDPLTYEHYENVILTHSCREVADLEYGKQLVGALPQDPLIGEYSDKFIYFPTVTRENYVNTGRITHWLQEDRLTKKLGLPALSAESDRVMICGSIGLNKDISQHLEALDFVEGANSSPGHFVLERAFVG